MKTNKVLLFLAVILAANLAVTQMMSCKKDNPTPTTPTKSVTHTPDFINLVAADRAHCDTPGMCNLSITSDINTTMDICGQFPAGSSCNEGCLDDDSTGGSAEFEADEPREMCVAPGRRFCIRNTGAHTAHITVVLNGTSSWDDDLVSYGKKCFRVNGSCELIEDCQ